MKKETWSIMLGCAFGALIGGLCAREIQLRLAYGGYLWISGAFLGGAIAWCAGEFKQLWASIVHAYRDTIAWKPDLLYWKTVGATFLGVVTLGITMYIGFFGLFYLVSFLSPSSLEPQIVPIRKEAPSSAATVPVLISALSGVLLLMALVIALGATSRPKQHSDEEYKKMLLRMKKDGLEQLLKGNPVGVVYYALKYSLKGLRYVVPLVPTAVVIGTAALVVAAKTAGQFIARMFIYAHSKKRRIRSIAAFIGVVVGFFFGSPIAGAIIGAIVGGVEYNVVSIKWLKLVSARAK
ncbi:MAG: hypothetical protein ABSB00_00610 [Minisyncoccia bacterium]|jgi:hypothetical protein